MKMRNVFSGSALVALLLFATGGIAQPINLLCAYENNGRYNTPVTFDERAGTAAWEDQTSSNANITDSKITWESNVLQETSHSKFVLSRLTGDMIQTAINRKGERAVFTYHCTVPRKQF
jgi:hypothetical protein